MSKKLTYEYIKNQIETVGYKLLSPVYINNKAKIKIQCNKGHVYEAATGNFLAGQRCPVCAGKQQHTYDYIKEQLEKEGYKLLSNEYKNNKTKLKLQCPKGHIWYVRWDIFLAGNRCLICSGKKKHTYEYVKNQIEKEGYKLLSKKYENTTKKIKVQCPKGHIYNVKFGNWLHLKHRCLICYEKQKSFDYDYIKEQIEKEGYKLLSKTYTDCKHKIKVQCTKGHIYSVSYNSFQQGKRCPVCYSHCQSSRMEKDVTNIVKSLINYNVIENDRTQIINNNTGRNLELDVWIPDIMKAVEFNGTFWHSSDYSKNKDNQKIEQCKNKGINLLVIDEYNWINNKTDCINILKTFLQV